MIDVRRMAKAGIGTPSWSHSSAGRRTETSRTQRLNRLKPRVTNSQA